VVKVELREAERGQYRMLLMIQDNLRGIALSLEKERPVLAYKSLMQLRDIVSDECQTMAVGLNHEP
jgi:hypothetical protein